MLYGRGNGIYIGRLDGGCLWLLVEGRFSRFERLLELLSPVLMPCQAEGGRKSRPRKSDGLGCHVSSTQYVGQQHKTYGTVTTGTAAGRLCTDTKLSYFICPRLFSTHFLGVSICSL